MGRHRKSIFLLASVSLVACSSAEFRPRAVGNTFADVSSAQELVAQGRGNFRGGNFALAIQSFRRALRQDPRSLEAYNGLAASYDRLGRFDLARRYYEEGLAMAPADARLRHNLAVSLRMQGLAREAAMLESETARLAGAAAAPDAAVIEPEAPAAEPTLPPRLALADRGPSDSVTIVLPPPAPMPAPRVEQALPRLQRISTAEVELVTRSEPARTEAPRGEAQAEARPLPVRTVRDTTREVVIRIGEPEPATPPALAAPPRSAAPVALAQRQAPVAPRAPRPMTIAEAMPPRVSPPPAPPWATVEPFRPLAMAAASTPGPATRAPLPVAPPAASLPPRPARPAPVMARRVTGTVTAAAPAPAPAPAPASASALVPPAEIAVASIPHPATAPTPVASPRPTRPASAIAAPATGTATAAAASIPTPVGVPPKPRAAPAAPPALTHYPAYTPLIRVARSEGWRPLERATRLAWASLGPSMPQVALAQYRSPMRILNAVGRRGQAARMQAHLRGFGWAQSSIGDARSRRIRSILLTPPGTMRQARAIAATLPFRVRFVPTSSDRPLLLVLGRDALAFDDRLRREVAGS